MYANGAGPVETYNIVGISKCAYNNVCYLLFRCILDGFCIF